MTCPSPPSGQRKRQLCQFIRGGREGDEEASMWLKELSLSVGSPLKRLPINLERSLCLSLWAFGPPPLPSPAPVKKVSYRGKGHLRTPKPSRLSAR